MNQPAPSSHSVDVLVIGFGGAGATAAMTAHDLGASTLIVEKAATPGGNTRASGGSLRVIAKAKPAGEFLFQLAQGGTPAPVLETFVAHAGPALDWLRGLGAELVPYEFDVKTKSYPSMTTTTYPQFTGAHGMGGRLRVRSDETPGLALWRVLERGVAARKIPTWFNTAAQKLITDAKGRVTGAVLKKDGAEITVTAKRAVVMACGGFSYNPDMLKNCLGVPLLSFGPPGCNTGDGIRMAQALGADLWHMSAMAATLGYSFADYHVPVRHVMPAAGFIYVDQHGKRFLDETGTDFHALPMELIVETSEGSGKRPRLPSYVIFDEATRKAGRIANPDLTFGRDLHWSADNSAEVAKGWIARGDNPSALATALKLPADHLAATIAAFNAGIASDQDSFGRNAADMAPLNGPFYGLAIYPVLVNTQGGPRRDEHARILDKAGQPIAGLYAAGELGSIWNELYPGAGNVTEALVYGRIAGTEAARHDHA